MILLRPGTRKKKRGEETRCPGEGKVEVVEVVKVVEVVHHEERGKGSYSTFRR